MVSRLLPYHITLNMKRSLLKYFFIFIFSISASIVAQSHSLSFDGDNDYVEILTSDSIITSYQGVTFNFYFTLVFRICHDKTNSR